MIKLDEDFFHISTQKLDFLGVFSLTTVGRRDELVQQKRRKRRRMLRERSPSPPVSQSKRTPPPPPPPQLITRFTPEEMDRVPELEDKKRFLTMFRLSHVTVQQRRGKGSETRSLCHTLIYLFTWCASCTGLAVYRVFSVTALFNYVSRATHI